MGKIKKVNFRNDLWNAEIKGEIKTTQGKITLRCFVPYEEQFIILTMNVTDQENEVNVDFVHNKPSVRVIWPSQIVIKDLYMNQILRFW